MGSVLVKKRSNFGMIDFYFFIRLVLITIVFGSFL